MPTDHHHVVRNMLEYHRNERLRELTADDVLNRFVREHMKRLGRPPEKWPGPLKLDDHPIARESWEMGRLAALTRSHGKREPKREHPPIIVLRLRSEELLMDGTKRINKWEHEKRSKPHEVLVIEARRMRPLHERPADQVRP